MINLDQTMEIQNYLKYQTANVMAVVLALAMNFLVELIPLNGVNTAQVSDSYPNLFTPPGYVFAIWGIIYILAIVFAAYQARPSQRQAGYLNKIGYLYLLSSVINVTWLAIFHYSYGVTSLYLVSTVVLLLLLAVLLAIYVRLGIGKAEVPRREKLAVHLPFSIYLGWISVASIAGIASALNALLPGIPTDTQAMATAMMLVVALVLTLLMLIRSRDIVFALVVVWAVTGIATKQSPNQLIYMTALVVGVCAAAAILLTPIIKKKKWVPYYLS